MLPFALPSIEWVVKVLGVTLSNPTKELWPKSAAHPALTKRDLAEYFAYFWIL